MSLLKVLVADDDPDVLDLHRLNLESHYQLVLARDGREAWELFEKERPRCVVTDLNMPGLNGQELTERIRMHPRLSSVPIIILTGTTVDTDLPAGFWRIGTKADVFLEKPVSPEELLQAIRRQILLAARIQPLPPGKGFY